MGKGRSNVEPLEGSVLVNVNHRAISPTYESDGLGKQTVSTHVGL